MSSPDPSLFVPIKRQNPAKAEKTERSSLSFWQDVRRRFCQNKAALIGSYLLLILLSCAIIGPWISGHNYYDTHLELKNQAPSARFWLGTDALGRDVFTRIWWGARISLFVGVAAAALDLVIGVLWGGIAGACGGKVDEWMMRLADICHGIPYLLVVILLMVIMGSGLFTIILAMALTGWIPMARIVRAQVMQLKHAEYVLAARSMGGSFSHILRKHLIPNSMGPILVTITLSIPTAIFIEAFLSFLGLGVQAPIASWGTMAADGLTALQYYPWRLFLPAFFISLTMLAFNLVGDGLRDALDPRQSRILFR